MTNRYWFPKNPTTRKAEREAVLATMTEEEAKRLAPQLTRADDPASYMTFEEACDECQKSIDEMVLENPEVGPDDVAHDIVMSYQMYLPVKQRRMFREQMGFYID